VNQSQVIGLRRRLAAMIAIDVAAFGVAAVAIVCALALHMAWGVPVFVAALLVGFAAQGWFVASWLKASKGDERR
jgi:Ni/Fe-hydrogenase subunit HybB-like protein